MSTAEISTAPNPPKPRAPSDTGRVAGYDVARSIAILGMIVVHFGLVMAKDPKHPAWAAAILAVFDGRAAATFMILAGVGVTLKTRRAVESGDPTARRSARRGLLRRGIALLVLGFLNLCIWPGDILRVYGVSLLLVPALIAAPSRRLLGWAGAFYVAFLALMGLVDYGKNWDWESLSYRGLWTVEGAIRNLFYDGFRSVFPWTGLLLFGMWLGRKDLRDRRTSTRAVAIAGAAALAAEVSSRLLLLAFRARPCGLDAESIDALFGTASMPPLPLFALAAAGEAVVVIALCVRLAEAARGAAWLGPFVAIGQMALTVYFAHIVLGLGAIVALGLATSRPLPEGEFCGAAFFATAALLCWLWKRGFRDGPLEALMRRLG